MTSRPLPGAGIGPCPLATHRQLSLVPESAITAYIDKPFDIHTDFFSEVALDLLALFDDLTDFIDLVLREILHLLILIDLGLMENLICLRAADSKNIRQANLNSLLRRKCDSCDSCHFCPRLALSLFMPRVYTDDPKVSFAPNDFTVAANFFD